jgi:two-component system nitrogen regulation sensor histidine kinase GlnL
MSEGLRSLCLNAEDVLQRRSASMKEFTFSTDRELRLRSWHQGTADMLGRSASDLIGKKYYDLFPRIFIGDRDALLVAASRKRTVVFEGYSMPCLYAGIKADIIIEPALSPTDSVNEIKVTVRPHAPCAAARKLDESQRLIDIGKVASTLAHGVRNPLNAIKGAVVYLRGKYEHEAPLIEFTKIMEEEISRLEGFISRFLSSSISNADHRATDVNALLRKIEVFIAFQLYTRSITPAFELGDVPPVVVNSFHVEQAVLNVINNAIEAMKTGGRLAVRTSTEVRSGEDFLVIAVSDTGPGMMDREVRDFDDATRSEGKGFGLFISYEVLKYYNGNLTIESRKNEGTTVRLYLPLPKAGEDAL